jgi:hypothetical protein
MITYDNNVISEQFEEIFKDKRDFGKVGGRYRCKKAVMTYECLIIDDNDKIEKFFENCVGTIIEIHIFRNIVANNTHIFLNLEKSPNISKFDSLAINECIPLIETFGFGTGISSPMNKWKIMLDNTERQYLRFDTVSYRNKPIVTESSSSSSEHPISDVSQQAITEESNTIIPIEFTLPHRVESQHEIPESRPRVEATFKSIDVRRHNPVIPTRQVTESISEISLVENVVFYRSHIMEVVSTNSFDLDIHWYLGINSTTISSLVSELSTNDDFYVVNYQTRSDIMKSMDCMDGKKCLIINVLEPPTTKQAKLKLCNLIKAVKFRLQLEYKIEHVICFTIFEPVDNDEDYHCQWKVHRQPS